MKNYRELLSNKNIYPFEATPAVNNHLEEEVIKANIQWLISLKNYDSYAGWEDTLDDLITLQEKELFSTHKSKEMKQE